MGTPTTPYVDTTNYSPLGQVLQTTVGPAAKQLRTAQTYDQATGRPATNRVTLQTNTANPISDVTYGYDQAGNVTAVSDTQSSGGTDRVTDTQCFQYDTKGRLITAWTDTKGVTAATTGQVARCTSARPGPATVGGPAPYWLDWQYNLLGDRTQQVQHDVTGNAARNTTQTSSYPGAGTAVAARPNAAGVVTTANPTTGTSTLALGYDPAGNAIDRTTTGAATAHQTVDYDDEGRTATTVTDGRQTGYLYDADGALLVQRGPDTTVLYLFSGAEQISLDNAARTVSGLRHYRAPDGTVIVRSSAAGMSYQPTGLQGTAQLQVDAKTLAVTRRAFDPYGNARGTGPGSWADNHGFLGQPADRTAGVDLLGARSYDPVLGRFLSVDPVFESGDPNQMGGYSYAADNPATHSDPSGQCPRDICDGYGQNPTSGGGSGGGQPSGDGDGDDDGDEGVVLITPHFAFDSSVSNVAALKDAYEKAAKTTVDKHFDAGYGFLPYGISPELAELGTEVSTWDQVCQSAPALCTKEFAKTVSDMHSAMDKEIDKEKDTWGCFWGECHMEKAATAGIAGVISPFALKFMQSSVSRASGDGYSVFETARSLQTGELAVEDLPTIRIVQLDDGLWTLDHRRLLSFQMAKVEQIPYVLVDRNDPAIAREIKKKFTTTGDGTSILIKNTNGGTWRNPKAGMALGAVEMEEAELGAVGRAGAARIVPRPMPRPPVIP
ncbi:RHS repeat-associated core domain-containing protein [Kitasatospora sp. NPDC088346]|uniref:RHS repeat-associated core domain-containing protein n=1 Tax=Kitasatospora sp. NPDC088346 TaxID=3364073 RepID=UPI00380181F1